MNARRMLKPAVFLLILILLLPSGNAVAAQKTFRVGVITDGPLARYQDIAALYQSEITSMASSEFDVRFPRDKQLDVLRSDAVKLPFASESFDIVYSFKVLAHVEGQQP